MEHITDFKNKPGTMQCDHDNQENSATYYNAFFIGTSIVL